MLLKKILFFLSFFVYTSLYAVPYVPTSKYEVVRVFSVSSEDQEIKQLRKNLRKKPDDFISLDRIIKFYMKKGRNSSDPRYFGYAEALLNPYLKIKNLPENIIIHWADILQHRHDFDEALQVLNTLANKQSSYAQVYLMRAIIHLSRAEYGLAMDNCKSLIFRASQLVTISCVAQVESLSGQLQESFILLEKTLRQYYIVDEDVRLWAMSLLADMALREGKYKISENYYQKVLSIKPNDYYGLANYADLLIVQHRYKEVMTLLSEYLYVDSLLLRQLIAYKSISDIKNNASINKLASNYRLLEMRNESAHLRDQARFYFEIKEDDEKAYQLARDNWEKQKEPADAKLLLKIAIRLGHVGDIKNIITWMKQQPLEDIILNNLLRQLAAY